MIMPEKKGGKGTHGSLSKAGKVRDVSPKWETERRKNKKNVLQKHRKKHSGPLQRNKRLAHLRGDRKQGGLERESGQYYPPLY